MIRNATILLAAGALIASLAVPASAQTTTPPTPLQKQLDRVDLGVSGIGQFNSKVQGPIQPSGATNYCSSYTPPAPQNCGSNIISVEGSNTVGAYANVRYIAKPYVGFEFNYTYARYTETLNDVTTNQAQPPGQIQTGVNEYSLGYVITPRQQIFGLHPFVSLAAGSTRFRPTKGGGQSAPTQWRATYSYNVGVQKEFGVDSHFGVRASFRQAFFKAPDFLLNYLTINKHTSTIEPTIGFYARF